MHDYCFKWVVDPCHDAASPCLAIHRLEQEKSTSSAWSRSLKKSVAGHSSIASNADQPQFDQRNKTKTRGKTQLKFRLPRPPGLELIIESNASSGSLFPLYQGPCITFREHSTRSEREKRSKGERERGGELNNRLVCVRSVFFFPPHSSLPLSFSFLLFVVRSKHPALQLESGTHT